MRSGGCRIAERLYWIHFINLQTEKMLHILTQPQQKTTLRALFYIFYERQDVAEDVLSGEWNPYLGHLYTEPKTLLDKLEEDGNLLLENKRLLKATFILIERIRDAITNSDTDIDFSTEDSDIINEALIQYLSSMEMFVENEIEIATDSPDFDKIKRIYLDMQASWNIIFTPTELEKVSFWIAENETTEHLLHNVFVFRKED
jgi:hypothetical protein